MFDQIRTLFSNLQGWSQKQGPRIWIAPCASAQLLQIQILIHHGSLFEQPGEEGFAHFLEHLVFKKTKSYQNAKELAHAIESLGGDFNAYTAYDHMVFHASGQSQYWQNFLTVLSELVFDFRFDAQDIENERQVVIEEIHRSADQPQHRLFDNLFKRLFRGEIGENPILGSIDSLNQASWDKLQDFAKRFFNPSQMDIILTGDVPPIEELKKVFDFQQPITNWPSIIDQWSQSKADVGALKIWEKGSYKVPRALIGFKLPSNEISVHEWEAWAMLLEQGQSAPLERHLVEKKRLASVSCSVQKIKGLPPLLFFQLLGKTEQLSHELPIWLHTLETMTADLHPTDFKKIRLQLEMDLSDIEENFEYYGELIKDLLLWGRAPEEQIRAWESMWSFNQDQALKALNIIKNLYFEKQVFLSGVCSNDDLPIFQKVAWPPTHIPVSPILHIPAQSRTQHCIVAFKRSFPISRSGGLDELTLFWAFKSPLKYTTREFARLQDSKGIEINTQLTHDAWYISLNALQPYFQDGVQLLSELLAEPAFRDEDWETILQSEKTAVRMNQESPIVHLRKLIHEHVAGSYGHYRHHFYRTEEDLETAPHILKKNWKRLVDHPVWTLVYSSTEPDHKIFHPLECVLPPAQPLSPQNHYSLWTPQHTQPSIEKKGVILAKEQTLISYTWATPGFTDPDTHLALKLVSAYFSGQAGILFHAFREVESLAYHVDSSFSSYEGLGLFSVYGACSSQNLAKLKSGLWRELLRFYDHGFEESEWKRAQATLQTQMARRMFLTHHKVERTMAKALFGRDWDEDLKKISDLSSQTVWKIFQRVWEHSQIFYFQVGEPLDDIQI